MRCEQIKKRWSYTELQERFSHISDEIIAEGWNHVWFIINGVDYFVYDNGDILREMDMEREMI